ncbi:MAG: electron transport complex subunit E [Eubacteriales bacterium]
MEQKTSLKSIFFNGIITENPTFRLVLGTCPTMAVTTSATNGVGMGVATTFVLLGSNIVISLLRNFIPDKIRIPSFIIVICTFVTMVQMFMNAFVPALYQSLGIFLPLIVVNCIILARAEAFASKNAVLHSAVDGIGMGIGFTVALTLIGAIREILGNGTVFGTAVFGAAYQPMLLMILPAGGFLVYGLLLALFNAVSTKPGKRKEAKSE